MTRSPADVVIIGAGVVGTAIARTLAAYALDLVLVDAASDVGTGTSKANTAILHTGFDAKPGSLESRLLSRGSGRLRAYASAARIAVERTGALLVAWTPDQVAALPGIEANARRNGYQAVRRDRRRTLHARAGPGTRGARRARDPGREHHLPLDHAACLRHRGRHGGRSATAVTQVTGVVPAGDSYELATTRGPLRCRWVVNAAGLGSDTVDQMFGGGGFTIRPRRGEFIVFDKLARTLLRSILLPVPTARTKGVLVAPTVYGNVLLGPTAEDVGDRSDMAATEAGLRSLLAAGRRILPGLDEESRYSAAAMIRWLAAEGITHGVVSTPLAELMIGEPWPERMALRTLTTGGDRLRRWLGPGFPCPLVNIYGPSEATVVTTAYSLLPGVAGERMPPIGRPLGNVRVYLLDPALDPVPPGAAGELWIGGGGLARDYLDRPALTAERFAPDPFAGSLTEPGGRLYRTGDLARYLPSGDLEFLGRADFQIKIRGFRIEPGEIEAELVALPGIREATVLARDDGFGDLRLVAYLVPSGRQPESAEVRAHLEGRLPDYMVPSAFVWLAALPLTPNGKIDRQALAAIEVVAASAEPYVAPRTLVEEGLAELWAELLDLDRVGIRDPFVHLGGHSLVAVQLLSRVRRLFGVELSVQTLFDARTVEGLARAMARATRETRAGLPEARTGVPLVARSRAGWEAGLPLSPAQARLWFLDRVQPDSALYNVPTACRLRGALDPAALGAGLAEIVRRHEALRTRFVEGADGPLQVIAPPGAFPLPWVDLGGLPEGAREAEAARLASAAARRPFDLARGPLFRALLLQTAAAPADAGGDWTLVLAAHHIVSDGWSAGVLARELAAHYGAALRGGPSPLPEPALQYADFALWQREWLRGEGLAAELGWWRGHLDGAPTTLELPVDRPYPPEPSFRGATAALPLAPDLAGSLRALGRRGGATLFMTALAGFELALQRTAGVDDLLVGTPVAGRDREEVEGLIGLFVNTLVLRGRLDGDPTGLALLDRVRAEVLGAFSHAELPFDRLVEELAPARSLSRSPLIQTFFTLRDASGDELELPGLAARPLELDIASAKFELALTLSAGEGDELTVALDYATDLYDPATAARLLVHFERLLAGLAAAPERASSQLELLSPAERQQLFVEWNDSAVPEAAERAGSVPEWFAAQARERPAAPALEAGDERLSYGELAARVTRLARRLRALGVGREVLVGVCLERSAELVVALLAVLEAGGAYLPLDPAYPQERLAWILEDSAAALLISERRLQTVVAGLPAAGLRLLLLDDAAADREDDGAAPPDFGIRPSDLAYVIYTSGSTGRPKGVAVEHGNLANLLAASRLAFGFDAGDVMPVLAPFSFDIFLFELLSPLVAGGTALLLSLAGGPDLGLLAGVLARATHLHAVPALMQQIVERARAEAGEEADGDRYSRLRTLFTGGDAVPASLLADLRQTFPGAEARVLYGPTEATILASSYRVPAAGEVRSLLGRPLANMALRLCAPGDPAGRPVPLGTPGEIWIGGAGVARGYLGRAELTAECYREVGGERWYRSGDLARHLPDGTLEFLGRTDDQVKVRGFRIELGEVEAALLSHPQVREAAVLALGTGGEKRLVAYVTGEALEAAAVREHLRSLLPDYMVPSALAVLDALPLTANGKVDRRALAQIAAAGWGSQGEHVAPRTPVEKVVARIWAELLGVERIGVHDDFFAQGGHSLLAVQALSRVRRLFGVDLSVRALFEAPTVEALARRIETAQTAQDDTGEAPQVLASEPEPPLAPVSRDRPLPLSFAQGRLWFLDRAQPGTALYSMPQGYRLRGPLVPGALAAALGEIVRRHESLRTRFVEAADGGEGVDAPVQSIAPAAPFLLPQADLAALPARAREGEAARLAAAEARRPFDLAQGPLFRALLLHLAAAGEDDWTLVLATHHIVSDGWSADVLARELAALYGAALAAEDSPLPEPALQYADFAVWQRARLRGGFLEAELGFWREHLAGAPTVLELPTDRPYPATPSGQGATVELRLPPALTAALHGLGVRAGTTLFMTALAGFELFLQRYTGQSDLLVGTPAAGRDREELEGVIGLFVNTLVMRGGLDGDPTGLALLDRVRAEALAVAAHAELPFDKLVEELAPARSLSRSPLIQTLFSVADAGWQGLTLPGIASRPLPLDTASAKVELALTLTAAESGLAVTLDYATDLYDPATAARMLAGFERLLSGLAAAPERPLSGLDPLSAAERQQLLVEWNDGEAPKGAGNVPEWLAAQARARPAAPALEAGEERLSYGELEARANRLARRLRWLGVGREVLVGVCLERSAELVVTLLAVLKAGGAWLPLDPAYPQERLAYLVEDSAAAVLVSERRLGESLPAAGRRLLLLDEPWEEPAGESETPPAVEIRPSDLAYVIYTSGSTGRPKGVAVEHGNLANVLTASRLAFGFDAGDVMPVLAPFSFDIFLFELLNPLVVGGTALLVSLAGGPDLGLLTAVLARATRLHAVPALMQQIVERVRGEGGGAGYPRLRTLFTGGDAVPASLLADLRQTFPGAETRVLYGPTEATIIASSHAVPRGGEVRSLLGRPLANMALRLSVPGDPEGRPVPLGAAGEIWIGGAGVARGYLGRPELTAERYREVDGGRWYRSGDLARHLPDGTLEFLGRADDQVKIRGFRIELGEVEAALLSHPQVREAAVLALGEGGEKRLVAYVAGMPGEPLEAAAVRDHLRALLPDYMVPSAFAALDALPLTANGKVDRRALARTAVAGWGTEEEYLAPRTPVERALARIWGELLGAERIGVRDDFFARGGHSLLAVQALSRVRRLFGVELSVQTLFGSPTIEALAQRIEQARSEEESAELAGEAASAPLLVPVLRDRPLPLSFAQGRLWFLDRVQPGSSAYNLPVAYRLRGRLDPAALAAALGGIVRRHESLRTRFADAADAAEAAAGPVQEILPAGDFALPQVDLGALPAAAREGEAARLLAAEGSRPFDLARGPLFRVLLLAAGPEEWTLLVAMHHIVSDGWSVGVMRRELAALYGAALAGEPSVMSPLPPLPVQYADYAVWQRSWLQGDVLAGELAWWRQRLAGHPPLLELPADRPRPAVQSFRGASEPVLLDPALADGLRDSGRRRGEPLFITVLTGFLAFLQRYTGETDLLVGTPSAGRGRFELEGMIGFFVNTLVLRTDVSGDPSFAALAGRARESALGAQAHGDLPFERIVEELAPERSLGHSPLFQVAFALQMAQRPGEEMPNLPGLEVAELPPALDTAKFDLTFALAEEDGGLRGDLEYSRDLFDAATARRMAAHLSNLLAGAAADPAVRLSDLPLLSAPERRELLVEWNRTRAAYPRERSLHGLFAERARETPDAVAVIAAGETITYGEVEARAEALARRLRAAGVGPETLVALAVERSLAMVVAALAILKAGGAYVPLDPSHPSERLAFLLADTAAPVLLTQESLAAALPAGRARRILLDRLEETAGASGEFIDAAGADDAGGDRLAYVIYTSGSTGRPKGVAVPHRAVVRLVRGTGYLQLGPADRVAQGANAAFDAAIFELWGPLLNGGSLVILPPDAMLAPAILAAEIRRQDIGTLFLTTALFNQMAREAPGAFAPLDALLFGGEAADPQAVRAVLRDGAPRRLLHLYGPTESTTFSTWSEVRGVEPAALTVPIGKPIANTRAYVLDATLQPVPVGVHGALFVGGDGLARGYLNRPELTAERFVPDPQAGREGIEPGARLYATGDQVRYLPSGDVDFLGRADQQVKIRGFRIELGEIEAALAAHPRVREAAVLALGEGAAGKRLVAFATTTASAGAPPIPPELAEVREHLRATLPDYMVPSAFVWLEALPLTPNGKLDRRALARLESRAVASGEGYVAPRTTVEKALARMWGELLEREAVGLHDDFFQLGGHSLLAIQVLSRIRRRFGIELGIRTLFEASTLEGLARAVERAQETATAEPGSESPALAPLVRALQPPLSFAQSRLWVLDRLQPGSAVYNVPLAYRLHGRLEPAALAAALGEIVRRHETLRTRFGETAAGPVQIVEPAAPFLVPVADLASLPAAARQEEAKRLTGEAALRPFDLERGPLFRALLLQGGEADWTLLLAMHHIVSDGWSLGILLRELEVLYAAARGAGVSAMSPLPELPTQYADIARWQRGWLRGEELARQLAYWRERLAGHPPVLELPADRPRPAVPTMRGGEEPLHLGPDVAAQLRELGLHRGAPLFMTLLAGFLALLARSTGETDLLVGTPQAGRNREEIEGLIGFFVNTLVLRTDLSGDPSFGELLERVRQTALGAYAHGDLPFDRLVEEVAPERSLGVSPLFQVTFSLETEPVGGLRLAGLAAEEIALSLAVAKFDLTVAMTESESGLGGAVLYSRDLFDAATARRLGRHLEILLAGAAAQPQARLSELPLLADAERDQLLREWNDTAVPFPAEARIDRLFAAQAARTPEAVAVIAAEGSLTYCDLDLKAERLARRLRGMGVGAETLVGLFLERSLEMVVALLAVLKAGGAYVPLDPEYPAERLAAMFADAGIDRVLTQSRLLPRLPEARPLAALCLDAPDALAAEDAEAAAVTAGAIPDADGLGLAYVLFTSGSTGRPKGAAISQRALANHMLWMQAEFPLEPGDRVLQKTPFSFDASVWEFYAPLLAGATLVMAKPGGHRDAGYLTAAIREHGVTILQVVPSLLRALLDDGRLAECRSLRRVFCGGEELSADIERDFFATLDAELVNLYGPTETTIEVAFWRCERGRADRPALLGRPIANARLHVLSREGGLSPLGTAGEIGIGGVAVGRGYLGRPAETAARFVPDPFAAECGEPGGRLYLSGDRGRRLAGGELEFLGRIDGQVKVRGFRIELGEVEAALAAHPAVASAAVVARGPQLAAFFIAREPEGAAAPLAPEALRAFLAARLPEHMVPGSFVRLEELPLTPSGKLDRRALAAIAGDVEPAMASAPPRTVLEGVLAGVWTELLGLPSVGVRDNFFHLGGQSLLATRLVSRVRRLLDVELEIRTIFEEPTIAGLARRIEAARGLVPAATAPPLVSVPRGRDPRFPLSFAQARLWFLDQLEPGALYNVPAMFRVEGDVDVAALAGGLAAIVSRHEALRTHFGRRGDEPVQVIAPSVEATAGVLPLIDLSSLPAAARSQEGERLAVEEAARPFDLARGPLARFALVRLAPAENLLFLSLHHIVSDAWSMGVLLRELGILYAAFRAGLPPRLPELPVQYADYAVWQRDWLQGEVLAREIDYWRGQLGTAPAVLDLPTDRPRPAVQSFRGGSISQRLPAPWAARIDAAARELGGTRFILWMAAFQALLGRLTRQPEINVGTPVAGRTRVELEGLIGFFLNTLVLRTDLAGDPSFGELVGRVREGALGAHAHQAVPFEKLVEALEPERSLSHTPLFQVMFAMQDEAPGEGLPGLRLTPFLPERGTAKFDLLLGVGDQGNGLEAGLEYSSDLFDPATAARLLELLTVLLDGGLSDPARRLSELPLLTPAARAQVQVEWNDSALALPRLAVAASFTTRAAATPGATALSFAGDGGEELTYAEVEARANRLAHLLRRRGVGPDVPVGVCLERSLALPVALLAVLKAGGVFLPLDPAYPADRLEFMLADAGAAVLLSARRLLGLFPAFAGEVLLVEDLDQALAAERAPGVPPAVAVEPENLSYLIYTSGSTGWPKGAALTHRALENLVAFQLGRSVSGAEARTLQFTSMSFDVCFQEILSTWGAGGTLVLIADDDRRDPEALLAVLEAERITRLFLPFVALNQLAETAERRGAVLPWLREVITAGEQLRASEAIVGWFRRLRGCRLENHYGPSETHVATAYRLPLDPGTWPALPPIGRPVLNSRLHLLDPQGGPVPVGVPGELFLGGAQTARGYLGRPELTAARFVPDPFAGNLGVPGERLYRSGDLARYRPDGKVEFLGRVDLQVKVRGYRIEPAEIETVLAAHPAVGAAAVLAPLDAAGGRRLVAYLAPAVPEAEIREYLRAKLPDYAIPSAFVGLPELPLTPSGKVDRRALAAIAVAPGASEEHVAPRTETEELVAAIWGELLGRGEVGARDDFFHLGGHSLLATQVVSRVRRLLGVELAIRTLFESSTVEALARRIDEAREAEERAAGLALAPARRDGELPLSFAQARLWFLDRLQPGSSAYNMPMAYRLRGELAPSALASGLAEVVRRHETLRTRFAAGAEGPVQAISPAGGFALPRVDLDGLPDAARAAEEERLLAFEATSPFDLERGPLLRTLLLRAGEREWTLVLAMHHIVSDGWSMGVLLRELAALYAAALAGKPSPLPELAIQYADFAVWQREWLRGEVLEGQLAYWRERLAGHPPVLELPADRPRPAVQSFRGAVETLRVASGAAARLVELGRRQGAPLFMTALAGFLALLHRYTGQADLLVGTPTAGRNRVELEGLIGFFVNTLVLRNDASGDPAFTELLERVRETSLGAYAHGDLPFERLVEELAPERDLSHSPLFQVLFVVQTGSVMALPRIAGLETEAVELSLAAAKFDLTVALAETAEGIAGALEYNLDLFDATTARRMAGHLANLLAGAAAHPEARLSELPLLAAAERDELLIEWNDTARPWDSATPVHELFSAQARRQPAALAVAMGNRRLTYGEIEAGSARLARRLRALGVGPEVRVGICAERTPERVIAIVAVLKAGGVYVSLDPSYPRERLAYLVTDARTAVLLTESRLLDRLPESAATVIAFDRPEPGEAPVDGALEPAETGPESLAYVVYTSGSTGRPKGVAIPHRGLLNLVRWHCATYGLTAADRGTLVASPAFDASVWEMWPLLAAGGSLHIPDEETQLSAPRLLAWWAEQGITQAFLPTPLAETLLEAVGEGEAPAGLALRTLAIGGDRLHRAPRPGTPFALVNHYGPSEYSVVTTAAPIPAGVAGLAGTPPIGRAIANTRVYVLDAAGQPVPKGVPGELHVGGDGLARAYLGNPALTAEKFVPDAYSEGEPGARLYRTGDLVRWLADGNLDFLGRIDHQVKLRGMRVELGEIETVLARHPGVREAVVVVREDRPGDRRLTAYVADEGEAWPAEAELRDFLEAELPAYMVPQDWLFLDALPLTANGKVDRRALPAPDRRIETTVAPRTPMEGLLAGIFCQVLGLPAVGIHDNFFALGGHSLLATQVVSRVRRDLGIDLEIRALFEEPTIEGLARRAEGERFRAPGAAAPPLRPAARGEGVRLPLSFAQQRLWFLDRLEPGSSLYNIPVMFKVEGPLAAAALASALAAIVRRHEALRTRFVQDGDEPAQRIEPPAERGTDAAILPVIDLTKLAADLRSREAERLASEEAARPFDLARGPVARFALLRLADAEHALFLSLHHIVADGWSMGVLMHELAALYAAFSSGVAPRLPELPVQYADYALWQRGWLRDEAWNGRSTTGGAGSAPPRRFSTCRPTARDRRCRATAAAR